jgi:mediator of RNA polymerase II transcription subunit 25
MVYVCQEEYYTSCTNFRLLMDDCLISRLVGGRGESHANIAEALAASLICLEDLTQRREAGVTPQKHCILICNSPPYLMPVTENQPFAGNTAEQLASMFTEV